MTPAMARAAPPRYEIRDDGASDAAPAAPEASGEGKKSMWDVVSQGVSSAADSAKVGAEKTQLRAQILLAENSLEKKKREFGEGCYALLASDNSAALKVRAPVSKPSRQAAAAVTAAN